MLRLRTCLITLFAVLFAAACSTAPSGEESPDAGGIDAGDNSQTRYSYPGCEDAGTAYCPNDKKVYCMRDKLRAKYDSCSVDSDCVLATGGSNCLSFWSTSCDPDAVSEVGRDAYLSEIGAELARYCADPGCVEFGDCGPPPGERTARCLSGHCVVNYEPDAGVDAGTSDAGTMDSGI